MPAYDPTQLEDFAEFAIENVLSNYYSREQHRRVRSWSDRQQAKHDLAAKALGAIQKIVLAPRQTAMTDLERAIYEAFQPALKENEQDGQQEQMDYRVGYYGDYR